MIVCAAVIRTASASMTSPSVSEVTDSDGEVPVPVPETIVPSGVVWSTPVREMIA